MYIQVIDYKLRGFEAKQWIDHLIFKIQLEICLKQYVRPNIMININMNKNELRIWYRFFQIW